MFQVQGRLLELELQHRHSDDSWAEGRAVDHDPAASDPEREWANGQLFVCKACGEGVRVSHAADEPYSGATA
jgi:hypothetical protein